MSEGLNRVMLLGNLGADPELRTTGGGQALLKLRVATTESYLDKNQARQDRTEWHAVTLWGKRGEALAKILQKGERVFVEGSLRTTSYEKDGEKRYRTEIVASNIILSGRGEASAPAAASSGANRPRTAGGRSPAPPPAQGFGNYPGGDDEIPF